MKLFKDHKFNYVKKFIRYFEANWEVWEPISDKMIKNAQDGLPSTHELTAEELDIYKHTNPIIKDALTTVLSYCHPKLRAIEVDQGADKRMSINIAIPVQGDNVKMLAKSDVDDVIDVEVE